MTAPDGWLGLAYVVTAGILFLLALALAECVEQWWRKWHGRG